MPAAPAKPNVSQLLTAATALRIGGSILDELRNIARSLQEEPAIDNCYVVGGIITGPTVFPIQVPRTIKHAELGLSVDSNSNAGTQTPVNASATGAASSMAPALPGGGVGTGFTYVTGFEITGAGATAGSVITVTLAGLVGGNLSYKLVIPAGVTTSITPLQVEFPQPLQSNNPNGVITLNVPSFGAGNTDAAAVIHGYQQTTPGSSPSSVALFPGNVSLADAQNRHKATQTGAAGPSGAIITSSGGNSPLIRDYLDGAGYLTVYMSAPGITFATVRVRALDRTQYRAQRT